MLLLEKDSTRVLKALCSQTTDVGEVWWIVETLCEVHEDALTEGTVPAPAYCFTGSFAEQELVYSPPHEEESNFGRVELFQQHSSGSRESSQRVLATSAGHHHRSLVLLSYCPMLRSKAVVV